jgi:hypothetical protein
MISSISSNESSYLFNSNNNKDFSTFIQILSGNFEIPLSKISKDKLKYKLGLS